MHSSSNSVFELHPVYESMEPVYGRGKESRKSLHCKVQKLAAMSHALAQKSWFQRKRFSSEVCFDGPDRLQYTFLLAAADVSTGYSVPCARRYILSTCDLVCTSEYGLCATFSKVCAPTWDNRANKTSTSRHEQRLHIHQTIHPTTYRHGLSYLTGHSACTLRISSDSCACGTTARPRCRP